ncbi:MAG TPA: WbqC family protein [Streptosporangiaceae bacterium]|jgi:hypothetical protein
MAGLLCAIHQPNFLPRLSTLAKLYTADIWIILDNVQFTRRDYQHRCYLAPAADAQFPGRWLTIPVHLPGGRATLIRDVRLAEPARTAKRTSGILRHYYRRAPYRSAIMNLIPGIEETITGTERLADVSKHTTITLLRLLNWPGVIRRSSHLCAREGRSERLADLTRAVRADTYLCGTGGSRYLDPAPFTALGLAITMFTPPEHTADLPPENARRASVLADLAASGPERLSAAIRDHARGNYTARYPHAALHIVLRAMHVLSLGIHGRVYYRRYLRLYRRQGVPAWQVCRVEHGPANGPEWPPVL